LLLKNRLNTRGQLKRKDMSLDSYNCELCLLQKEENLRHIFFRCPFAKKKYWNIIGIPVPTWLKPKRAMRNLRKRLKVSFAMEIIIVTYVVVHMN
jgi:hypothetical protein